MKDKLDQLLHQARKASPAAETVTDDSLPPALATRIASSWSATDDRTPSGILIERVTACCLVPVLAAWAILAWNAANTREPDVMDLLYASELVVETPPPF